MIDLGGKRVIPGLNDSHPALQWVHVVGGWSEFQFAERGLPTLVEIEAVSPDTPVFILHLYDRAILNVAALRAVDYSDETPNPPGGKIQRDKAGSLTGILIARPKWHPASGPFVLTLRLCERCSQRCAP